MAVISDLDRSTWAILSPYTIAEVDSLLFIKPSGLLETTFGVPVMCFVVNPEGIVQVSQFGSATLALYILPLGIMNTSLFGIPGVYNIFIPLDIALGITEGNYTLSIEDGGPSLSLHEGGPSLGLLDYNISVEVN